MDRGSSSQPGIDPFVAYWQRRAAEQKRDSRRLADQARAEAGLIATMLRQQFHATRVLLFGSLTRGRFTPGSDIDLAVEGLAHADFFDALGRANALSRFWIDLKPLEDLDSHFRARVLETGEDL